LSGEKQPPAAARTWIGPQIFGVLLVAALASAMAIGPTRQLMEQRGRIAETADALDALQSSNRRLETRIRRLRDPDFLEQRAREEMGLVRPGETAYVVMAPRRSSPSNARGKREGGRSPDRTVDPPGLIADWLQFIGLDL
jgi:cell division protein FtsB